MGKNNNIEIINVGAMVFLYNKLADSIVNIESIQHVSQDSTNPNTICIRMNGNNYTYWKLTAHQFVELLKEVNLSVQLSNKEGLFKMFDVSESDKKQMEHQLYDGPIPV